MSHKITLNKLDVARNGAKAYLERKLSAQNETPMCNYRDDSQHPCVIGASLHTRTANKWDDLWDTDIKSVYEAGLIKTDDIDYLNDLQDAHDGWAQNRGWYKELSSRSHEENFIKMLNSALPEEEHVQILDAGTKV